MAATCTLVRHAAALYPCAFPDEAPIIDGWVRVEGPRVTGLGPEPCPSPTADVMLDGRGKVVLPGLVNLHHHFSQSLTRAVPTGRSARSLSWLTSMYPLWQELDPEAMHAGAQVAAAEMLLTGATTSVDFAYLYPAGQGDLFDTEVAAVRELGLRLHAVRGCTPVLEASIADELRGIPGIDRVQLVESSTEILAACERAIGLYHDPAPLSMCRVGVGPTAVPYDHRPLLEALVRLSEAARCDRHTHLQPRPDEVERCRGLHGCRPSEFLRAVGWLGERSWLAHCTLHEAPDIAVLAATGSGAAHCPSQNMRLGYPAGPIPQMRAAGVRVGIGVDGAGSNDGGSMLLEMRFALLVHRLAGVHPDYPPARWMTPRDVLWMATRDAAAILGRDDIGRLAPGAAADLVMVDLRQIGLAGGLHDPLGALLVAGDSTVVDTVLVNGQVVVRGGRLVLASHGRIVDDANRASARMVERARRRTGLDFGSLAPTVERVMRVEGSTFVDG